MPRLTPLDFKPDRLYKFIAHLNRYVTPPICTSHFLPPSITHACIRSIDFFPCTQKKNPNFHSRNFGVEGGGAFFF